MITINSPGYHFRRGTGTPFEATTNKQYDFGGTITKPVRWCDTCQMEVDTRSASYNQHQVWGQKHWCKRCGTTVASAVYFHSSAIGAQPVELFHKACTWAALNEPKG